MIHGTKKSEKKKTQEETAAENAKAARISQHLKEFMAVRHEEKRDLAALNVSTELLMELCEVPTIFNFRRELIEEQLKLLPDPESQMKLLQANLKLSTKLIKNDPKIYVFWSFRQWVVIRLFNYTPKVVGGELQLCKLMLMKDQKNFHVWNYRNWLNSLTIDVEVAIEFVHEKIKSNPFNFSPYHFLTKHLTEKYSPLMNSNPKIIQYGMEQSVFELELDRVKTAAFLNAYEEAPWNFYKWLIKRVLPCKIIDTHQSEGGLHLTTNFKTFSFASSVKLTRTDSSIVEGWTLRSDSGAEPSANWTISVQGVPVGELKVEVASNLDLKQNFVRTEYGLLFLGTAANSEVVAESWRIINAQIEFVEQVYETENGKCRFASLTLLELFRLTLHLVPSRAEWSKIKDRARVILDGLKNEQKGHMYIKKLAEAWQSLSSSEGPQLRPQQRLLLNQLGTA